MIFAGVIIYGVLSSRKSKGITYTDQSGEKKTESLQRRKSRKFLTVNKPEGFNITPEIRSILDLMDNTKQNVFLTGKAGTGKSTLLRHFRATTNKNHAVVAPTGIAAINVQGQTIHSFFGFRIGVTLGSVRPVSYEKLKVIRNLETLIIDEISMVRADLLDCIDKALRINRRNTLPFGGVQVIAIGDPYQLPPVVTASEEKFIQRTYGAPHFFNAMSYKTSNFTTRELTKVYRQSDGVFIDILNAIRTGDHSESHINQLNSLTRSNRPTDSSIKLVTTNNMAQMINQSQLDLIQSEAAHYSAQVSGNFSEKAAPTAIDLYLKEGARVMLLNNDREGRWVNGDVGLIIGLSKSSVKVKFEDGTYEDVEPNIWENIQFEFDEETQKIEPVIVGKFVQLPVKLAWAVTIHKSQGKTYEYVHIDFGSGTFAPGQAYVALSRVTSLNGLSFETPILPNDVLIDKAVKIFMVPELIKKKVTSLVDKEDVDIAREQKQDDIAKSDINKLKFFIQNAERYATGTKKSKEKVEHSIKVFNAMKNNLSDDEIKDFESALKRYKGKLLS